MSEKCCCGCESCESAENQEVITGEYVCYCNHVTEQDIIDAVKDGAQSVQEVIDKTGAMKNSNCAVNNPKGICCYPDIVDVFTKCKIN